jgi:hypothetical protein
MYRKARECIQGDPEVSDKEPWQERIHLLERLEGRASHHYQFNPEELEADYAGS